MSRGTLDRERAQQRYETLLDAFLTADRRRRGTLPFDRVSEIYSLYFHSSAGQLRPEELPSLIQKHTTVGADGLANVDYMGFADSVRQSLANLGPRLLPTHMEHLRRENAPEP